jgi:hypothetical protein
MKFDHTLTGNWENAFRGLRHPLESYDRSDSDFGLCDIDALDEGEQIINFDFDCVEYVKLGEKDIDLAQRMIKAGTPNDKFLRQIFTSVDITAPLYWWKEMDTYKVGTTANSTSTMHKLASTPITRECFELDDYDGDLPLIDDVHIGLRVDCFIDDLEQLRQKYLETKDVKYWKELIRWLPEGWLQTRTWTANYSILRNIIHWRTNHKLTEWHQFVDWCKTLPYSEELLFFNNVN